MTSLVEKQLNIWSVQDHFANLARHKELDVKLKVLRDQYLNHMNRENTMVLFESNDVDQHKKRKQRCNIL